MKLSEIKKNQIVKVNSIHQVPGILRVQTMGLTEGAIVKCESRSYGTIELTLHGTRLAISEDVAQQFTVEQQHWCAALP